MRTLSATLTAAQASSSYIPLWKVVLSRSGQTTQTYTKTRILSIDHVEGKGADIVLDNSDNALTDLNFEHFQAVISYGINTSAGEEYSDTAPLRVRSQEFTSQAGTLVCKLAAIGIRRQMAEDLARVQYTLEDTDTQTVKTLITAIAGTAMTASTGVFGLYTGYTVTYDSEDSIIDSFKPADYFRIPLNAKRNDKVEELLVYTNCQIREEDDGELHVLVPRVTGHTWVAGSTYAANAYVQPSTPNYNFTYQCTTAGTAASATEPTWPTVAGSTVADSSVVWTARGFHYEYKLADSAQHTFFSKNLRNRFVNPNAEAILAGTVANVTVGSQPSYSYAPKIHTTEIRPASTVAADVIAQANSIGAAKILRYELGAESGASLVPMNAGQELWDYVKITDSRESDDFAIGNVQYLRRHVEVSKGRAAAKFEMEIALGKPRGPWPPPPETQVADAETAKVQIVPKAILWALEGTLAATANASFEIPVPFDITCKNVWINVKTAPTGTALIVDVNLGGSTIFGTQANRPSIAAGSTNAVSGSVSVSALGAGQIMSIDIDQSGAVAAADLVVTVRGTVKVQK